MAKISSENTLTLCSKSFCLKLLLSVCVNAVCLCVNVCSCSEELFIVSTFQSALPSIMLLTSRRFMFWLRTGFPEQLHQERLFKEGIFVSSSFLFFFHLFFSHLFSIKDLATVNWRLQRAGTLPNTNHCRGFFFTSTYQQRQLGLCNCQRCKMRRVSSSSGARCSSWHLSHYTVLRQPQATAGCIFFIFLPISVSSACVLLLFSKTFWGFTDALSPFSPIRFGLVGVKIRG